ncbi:hypothetical protein [Nocardioides jensenii]|uniref:hypothetical protein n=1 Tax=Nocardioides jensenii TaxID=1843 RepID=UPI0008368A68|nr:hypothetical protein [Nocardioides jensenii]
MPSALITRPNDFAATLRRAVDRSGLCLESIQQRLAERGVEVSVATLSYWQSGNRVPGRKRSQMVVAHLESVLGLAPHTLRVLVPPPRPRGQVRAPQQVGLVPRFVEQDAVRRIAEQVQARSGGQHLTRISQHDVVRIDTSRRIESVRIRTVARADADGLEGIGVTQFFEDRTAGTPWLTVHAGAEVAARHLDTAHRVLGTELRFAQPLTRGDTVVLDYEITADGPGPLDTSYDASCGRAIREYVVEVHFSPDDLPEWVERYHRPRDEGQEVRRRVSVDSLGHAHYVVLDCAPGTTGLAWHH